MKPLRASDLEELLMQDKYTRDSFGGVWPINKIPKKPLYGKILIINTDPHYKKGKHWLCLHIPPKFSKEKIELFCSIGRKHPYISKFVKTWYKAIKTPIFSNTCRLQNYTSKICGHYCLMFSFWKSRGVDLEKFQYIFSTNYFKNDEIVTRFIRNNYPLL